MMEKIGRERRSENAWREIVEGQGQSGVSVNAFCEREGIKAVSRYGWRSRLQREPQHKNAPARVPRKARLEKPTGEFIDLSALSADVPQRGV